MRNGEVSFWHAELGGPPPRRPGLPGDRSADVCIVGAGYTGLWAAYYLKTLAPALQVEIVEAEFAGFGGSGRNGGWLSGGFAWNHDRYLGAGGRAGVQAMIAAMAGTVAEVIRVAGAEGIDARIRPAAELSVARNPAQLRRMQAEAAARRSWEVAADRVRLLTAPEARARVDVAGTLGAMLTEGVARIQPALLVRGLAAAVERRGVPIWEGTRARALHPGRVETDRGTLRAPVILRATEGFTATLPGHRRDWLPLNSAQIVTEPLPAEVWARIGWQGFEILGDQANVYCYAQRTDDGRITMGGRGIPYRIGSGIDDRGRTDAETVRRLTARLHALFPDTRGARIDHAWCGVLGVPRDWCVTVGLDPATGIGWAGGYVGIGVSTSNLAGRILADLVLGRDSELVRLPLVNRRVRRWEPEPLRWIGVRGLYALLAAADRREARGGPPSRLAAVAGRLMGR